MALTQVSSGGIKDGTILNEDINASASIDASKLNDVITSADIGSTIQAYDADTAKYGDTTANFTGTLQNGGSNVVVDSDIGSTIQAYDVDTAKLDVAQTWSAAQTLEADLTLNSQYDLRFADSDNSNYVGFQAPATVASNVTWTLPDADGATGQVLSTNGAGVLAFTTIAAGSSLNVADKTSAYTAVEADSGYMLLCSGSWTLSLTAAATLGDGWYLFVKNIGTGTITINPNASELIGGVSTAELNPGDLWLFSCTGTAFELNRLEGSNYSLYDSSTTFSVPAGVRRLFVQVWGGGGGGGNPTNTTQYGTGGGGGGYAAGYINVSPGDSCAVTIGSGGARGNTNGDGFDGGQSAFVHSSRTISADGGSGGDTGTNYRMGVSGGSGTGDWVSRGGRGIGGYSVQNVSGSGAFITEGGTSPFGGTGGMRTGRISASTSLTIITPEIPGGGGSGGSTSLSNALAGKSGRIIVQWV